MLGRVGARRGGGVCDVHAIPVTLRLPRVVVRLGGACDAARVVRLRAVVVARPPRARARARRGICHCCTCGTLGHSWHPARPWRRMQVGWRCAPCCRGCGPCWHSVLQCDTPLMTARAHRTVNLVGFPAMGPAERPSDAGTTCMARWETMSRNRDRLGHPRSPLPAAPTGMLPPCGTSRLGRGSGWRGG